jgi:hypothetical protein
MYWEIEIESDDQPAGGRRRDAQEIAAAKT